MHELILLLFWELFCLLVFGALFSILLGTFYLNTGKDINLAADTLDTQTEQYDESKRNHRYDNAQVHERYLV